MRSLAEIAFRGRQEVANLLLLYKAPQFDGSITSKLKLPDAEPVAAQLIG